jgi:glycine/D-amino acid oxidase-like deaminating enzyme
MPSADAVVVGAGIIGSSVALELAKTGRTVLVVDKAGGPGLGSTSASSAIIRFDYSTRDTVATAWESYHCWASWPDHLGAHDDAGLAGYVRTGYINLDTPISPMAKTISLYDEIGVRYEVWDAEMLKKRVPGIDAGRYWPPKPVDEDSFYEDVPDELGGVFEPDGGYINDPQLAAHNLANAAQHHGAEFLFNRKITSVEQRGDRVRAVGLADGSRIDAPVVVNAAGPWSTSLNRLAGVGAEFTIKVQPMRQEVHQVAAPASYRDQATPGIAISDMDIGVYSRPAPGGFLLVGSNEPECEPLDWLDDPDAANLRATARRFRWQITRAARRLPGLRVPNTPTGIAGVYDVAEDWTPIYDRTDLGGYYVAMGTSGNQFKNAPLAGRFIATLVERIEAGHDHDAEPLRYTGEHTGQVIDLGAFSRKRTINADSTFTVSG